MTNIEKVRSLLEYIAQSGLGEVIIETDEFKLEARRNAGQQVVVASAPAAPLAPAPAPVMVAAPIAPAAPAAPAAPSAPAAPAAAPVADSKNTVTVKSPMIGTFYRSPKPDSPAFVNVGDTIKKGQVVCVIEAMKLFNDIESEISGKIVKVLVDNATPVEYDQPLFLVEPA